MTTETITIRRATAVDIPTIIYQRQAMFRDMGLSTPASRGEHVIAAFERWLVKNLAQETYVGFFAVTIDANGAEKIAAGAGLLLYNWIPNLIDGGEGRGYLMNVYTEADFRKRGLARRLVDLCVDHCREQGIRVIMLHASDEGRPIYEKIGFKQTNEMRLTFEL